MFDMSCDVPENVNGMVPFMFDMRFYVFILSQIYSKNYPNGTMHWSNNNKCDQRRRSTLISSSIGLSRYNSILSERDRFIGGIIIIFLIQAVGLLFTLSTTLSPPLSTAQPALSTILTISPTLKHCFVALAIASAAMSTKHSDHSFSFTNANGCANDESNRSEESFATTVASTETNPASKRAKLDSDLDLVSVTPSTSGCAHCCQGGSTLSPCTTLRTATEIKQHLKREIGYDADQTNAVRKRQDYIGWEDYFMATAVLSSLRSKDPHQSSGCCIVDARNRIIGIGYNGFPMGASDDVLPWTKPSDNVPYLHTYEPYVVHSVINAILCSGDVQGARLFVSELPCAESAKTIIQAGISEVIYDEASKCLDSSSLESRKASRLLFEMSGVKLRKYVAGKPRVDLVRMDTAEASSTQKRDDALKISDDRLESHRKLMRKEANLEGMPSTKRTDYLSLDDYFMWMAFLTAQRSKDPNTQVGACLVLNKRIVGLGYNGFPIGCSDDLLPWARKGESKLHTKYPYVCHSEVNAIMNRIFPNIRGATLYVALFPCNECAKFIVQAGIREVVYLDDKYHDTDICRASRILFGMAGVKLRQHTPANMSLTLYLNQTNYNDSAPKHE